LTPRFPGKRVKTFLPDWREDRIEFSIRALAFPEAKAGALPGEVDAIFGNQKIKMT
jgi:hypothetical protein